MKISLLFPRPKRYIHNETFEPLGLLYLAAHLTDHHDVDIIDCFSTKMSEHEAIDTILAYQPNILCVSLTMSPTLSFALEVMERVKAADQGIKTIVGGLHATFDYSNLIQKPMVDYIILNEGEKALPRLLQCIETSQDINAPGTVYRKSGKVVKTEGCNLTGDLDELHFPARELLPKSNHYKRRQVLSSRGCIYKCIYFAATAMNLFRWRKRSPLNVFEEVKELTETHGSKFYFADDNLTVDNQRVNEICNLFLKNNLDVRWSCLSRIENLRNKEMLETMKAAGCYEIFLGVESGSQQVLQKMKRKYNAENVIRVVEQCNEVGINTTLSFIIGIPFETEADINATLDLARRVPTYNIAFHIFTPYLGTEAFNHPEEFGIQLLNTNSAEYDKNSYPVIHTRHLTSEQIFDYYCEGFGVSYQKARQKAFGVRV